MYDSWGIRVVDKEDAHGNIDENAVEHHDDGADIGEGEEPACGQQADVG